MTVWMLMTLGVSTVLAVAGLVGDRLAARFGVPRRFGWFVAAMLATSLPVIGGLRATNRLSEATQPPIAIAGASYSERPVALDFTRRIASVAPIVQSAHRFDDWLVAAWLLISSAMVLRLVVAMVTLRRSMRSWHEMQTSTGRVFVARDCGPAVTGVLRPRVVVPQWLFDEDEETRNLLLEHEFEHVRAGDTRLIFVAALMDALVPWNLPLRWMSRRLRLAIEIDCDARVVATVASPRRYGLALLAVGERFTAPLPLAAALVSRSLGIEARIEAIATPRARRVRSGAATLSLVTLAALGICSCAPWPALTHRSDASLRVTPEGTLSSQSAAGPLARDSADQREMSRTMDDVRRWMARYHPDVASQAGINAVTFITDSSGQYVRSVAELLSREQLMSRVGPALLPDSMGATELSSSKPPDPEPWISVGVRRAQIHRTAIIQTNPGVWAPPRFFITVIQLVDGGR